MAGVLVVSMAMELTKYEDRAFEDPEGTNLKMRTMKNPAP